MISFDTRVFNRQAELITALRAENAALRTTNARQRCASEFYLALVEAIGDDIMLRSEWQRFIAILRLSNPNLPGITRALREDDEYTDL